LLVGPHVRLDKGWIAIGNIELARDRIAHAKAGAVLHRQPRLQDAGELDDAEQHQQQHRQDQGEFHQALTRAAARSAGGPAGDVAWRGNDHCVIRVKMREAMLVNTDVRPVPNCAK
jgi:hypothetical protein